MFLYHKSFILNSKRKKSIKNYTDLKIIQSGPGIYTRGCQSEALASFENLGHNFEKLEGKFYDQTRTYRIKDRLIIVRDHKFSSRDLPSENLDQVPGICFEVKL